MDGLVLNLASPKTGWLQTPGMRLILIGPVPYCIFATRRQISMSLYIAYLHTHLLKEESGQIQQSTISIMTQLIMPPDNGLHSFISLKKVKYLFLLCGQNSKLTMHK